MAESDRPRRPARATRNALDLELLLLKERNATQTRDLVIRCFTMLIGLAISPFPLRYVYYSIKELAGKDTHFSMGVTATLSLYGVAATIKAAYSASRAKYWKAEFLKAARREVPYDH
jgi:hypothetical protein